MADVFSKLGDSLKSTLKVAGAQTQKSVDQVSIRTELMNKNNQLKKLFMLLGEAQYKCYLEEAESFERNTLYSKIDSVKVQISKLEKTLEDITKAQKDSLDAFKEEVKSTWNDVDFNDIFKEDNVHQDPNAELFKANINKSDDSVKPEVKIEVDKEEVVVVCPVCHTANHDYASYCIKCGNKIK